MGATTTANYNSFTLLWTVEHGAGHGGGQLATTATTARYSRGDV